MSTTPIFTPTPSPEPPEFNPEREASRLRSLLLSDAKEGYRLLCRLQKQGIERVWHHPRLSPQEAVDALGGDAARVFQAHGALTHAITAIAALDGSEPDILLPTFSFTVNQDGTITIGEDPYQPPGA